MKQQHSIRERVAPFAISAAVILGDRWSKLVIRHSMGAFETIPVVPGWLRIIHTENPGAAFGMLADGNTLLRSAVLIGVSALVLLFVASALWRRGSTFTSVLTRLALSLILGGAAGNLYDRVFRGTVTDFNEVYHGSWSFPA
ncbi:MAG: signal peptidase II, partial [Acidobacteriaceae bacterium]|nr:signal peptidase II [Acidobacteriaceae bacterium]